MRRRERWQGIAYVTWMEGDSDAGAIQVITLNTQSIAQSIDTLLRDYQRFVECDRPSENYLVRVLPRMRNGAEAVLDIALLYSGPSLRNILATAVVELDLVASRQTRYRVGSEERVRWVM